MRPTGPFKLDEDYLKDIEKGWIKSDQWEKGYVVPANLDFLHSPLKVSEVNGVSYPADRLQRLISNAHMQNAGHINATSPQRNTTATLSPAAPK